MGYIKKHPILSVIILMFIMLQLTPLTYEDSRQADPLTRTVMRINYYPAKSLTYLQSVFSDTWSSYVVLVNKKEENKRLREENKKLRTENFRLHEIRLQNKRLKNLLGFIEEQPYEAVPAKIIAGSPSAVRSEFVIIDKGKRAGITEGMPVAVENGIVGRVYMVDELSSQVMLITDPISAVDVIVQRSRARGIVQGNGKNCILKYIDREEDIQTGDRVITSGKDGFYPKGILIGTVEEVHRDGGIYSAVLRPEVEIDSLEEVLVLIASTISVEELGNE